MYLGPNSENPDAIDDGTMAPRGEQSAQPLYGDAGTDGPLLTEGEPEVVKRVLKMWTDQDTLQQKYLAETRVNELRRQGYANVEATKSQDRDEWLITVIGAPTVGLNKAKTLCRKFVASLFADPPEPDPKPAGADDVHRDQAEFSREVLNRLCGEGQLDYLTAMRRAEGEACTYRRAYVCFYVDPAGSRIPMQVEAHPLAVTADAPFQAPPQLDPATQQPIASPPLPAAEAVLRYVRPDGGLTDELAEAAWQWAPKLRRDVFDGRHVRLVPATSESLWEASGVLVASFTPLRDLKRIPEIAEKLRTADVEKLKAFPAKAEVLRPGDTKKERSATETLKGDDALIFTLRYYQQAGGEYPNGCYVMILGETVLGYRGPWAAKMPDGVQEPLDLPLTEVSQWPGECVMDIVGGGNDLRAQQLTALLEHTGKVLNQKTFVPLGSTLGENELLDESRRLIPVMPGQKPESESIEPLDQGVYQMWDALKTEMQEDVGLGATAENLTGGNSGNSGRAKFAIIGQAQVALTEPLQNMTKGYTRGCRVILQLVRAFFTKPQKLDFARQDGSYREKRWTGADLGSTKDVDLKPGSASMLSQPQKTEQIIELVNAGVQLDPNDVRDSIIGNYGVTLGMRENPFRQRVLRQIGTWEEGPPDGWQPPQPVVAGVDPASGQPVLQPGPDPAAAAIWEPVAADQLPSVAPIRLLELAKAMSGASYQRWPQPWRAGFDQEFARMQQFAGVISIPQQQAMAAQQAQVQQQARTGSQPNQANATAQRQGVQDVQTAATQ